MNQMLRILKGAVILGLLCALPCRGLAAADTNAAPEGPIKAAEFQATQDALRASLQLQEQLREGQAILEHLRRDAQEAAVQNVQALSNRLQSIEQSLAAQRENQVKTTEVLQSTTHFMLVVLGAFAAIGFIAIVLTAYFQWRTINRLAEISGAFPSNHPLELPALPALGPGKPSLMTGLELPDTQLAGAVGLLQKRLAELEHLTTPTLPGRALEKNGGGASPSARAGEITGDKLAQSKALLDRGQALLNQDKADEAVNCFEEALALDPNNADALVKKGTALEKLRKLTEAIECYDRAIALDSSLTIAYLHKGGLFNRMERFSEAVDCYEQALRTQEKRRAA